MLTKKFGVLNNNYNKKLEELDSDNLNIIIDNILDIESRKVFFIEIELIIG